MDLIIILGMIFLGLLGVSFIAGGAWLGREPFICPNCGHSFYAKWYQLMFYKRYTIRAFNQARLKCPKCKVRDMCTTKRL